MYLCRNGGPGAQLQNYSVNGAPWRGAKAPVQLGKMMEDLENHEIFLSEVGDTVAERAWKQASDPWGFISKSV